MANSYIVSDVSVEDISNFIKFGISAPGITIKSLSKKLSFIEHIAYNQVVEDDSVRSHHNGNWFWLSANQKNRKELIDDICKIQRFAETDPYYKHIMWRINNSDAYGIMKPIQKKYTEPFDIKLFQLFVKNYQLDAKERIIYNRSCYFQKLKYCNSIGATFEEFVTWVIAENIVGMSLNFAQATVVDSAVYGDINELAAIYMTDEYLDTVGEMKKLLSAHIASRPNLAEKYVAQGLKCKKNGDCLGFVTEQEKIKMLFSAPDGVYENEKFYYENECKRYLEKLGEYENK